MGTVCTDHTHSIWSDPVKYSHHKARECRSAAHLSRDFLFLLSIAQYKEDHGCIQPIDKLTHSLHKEVRKGPKGGSTVHFANTHCLHGPVSVNITISWEELPALICHKETLRNAVIK